MIGTDAATRSREQDNARKDLDAMSAAMIEEEGLLNHAQAALLLGVSVKRVFELVRLGKLRRFDMEDYRRIFRESCDALNEIPTVWGTVSPQVLIEAGDIV
jgi:hypothetical protein